MTAKLPQSTNVRTSRPADLFGAVREEMDRLFDRFNQDWPNMPSVFGMSRGVMMMPSLDLRDSDKSVVIEVELPGVDEKDISLTLKDGVVTIKGEKQTQREDKAENHYISERAYGSFTRSVQLPDDIDESKIAARFNNGVLTITVEKRPDAIKPERRIEIGRS